MRPSCTSNYINEQSLYRIKIEKKKILIALQITRAYDTDVVVRNDVLMFCKSYVIVNLCV